MAMLMEATERAGYLDKVTVGLDVASSEFKVSAPRRRRRRRQVEWSTARADSVEAGESSQGRERPGGDIGRCAATR